MAEFTKEIKRGRSQIMFQYLPQSTFSENGYWFKVEELKVRQFVGQTNHLLKYVENFVSNWDANYDMDISLYPKLDDMYYFGEIEEVYFEMFPLVFHCKQCGNVHPYWNLQVVYTDNPQLRCEFCRNGKLKQYPYVLLHNNGDIQPIRVATNPGKTTRKEKYDGITMKDTRSFRTATWYNFKTKHSLGDLGTKATSLPITKTMKVNRQQMMGGTHLSDGSVYYPALKSFVNLKHDTLLDRTKKDSFPYVQIGALLQSNLIDRQNFDKNFETKENDMFQKLLGENAGNEAFRNMVLEFAAKENINIAASDNNITSQVKKIFNEEVPIEKIIDDQSLHEFVFSWYENNGETLEDKIKEADGLNNYEQESVYREAKKIAQSLGLDTVMLLEKFPVIMMGIGYSRRSTDRKRSLLNPFRQKIEGKNKVLIPLLKNDNEAIIFKLNPYRVLAWLHLNQFLIVADAPTTKEEAQAFLYKKLVLSEIEDEKIAQYVPQEYKNNENILSSIMVFRLLHSYMHSLLQAGKTILGLDIDSLSEYLFTSSLSGAIYVSKLQGGGMGALVSAFDNDLARWLEGIYEKSNTCLYDPVCHQHSGACHACMYLKFSCSHFNHSLTRNLLIGGKVTDYDEYKEVVGYFDPAVDLLIGQWRNS